MNRGKKVIEETNNEEGVLQILCGEYAEKWNFHIFNLGTHSRF